ncbi:Gag-Pol polyprotein, partial [Nosema granulosis]
RWIADTVDMSHYAASNDGYCWMLNIVDSYSKFDWSFPLKDKSMKTYAKTFKKLFFCEGPSKKLHTDNGLEFNNAEMNELCIQLKVKRSFGRARNPQSQGQFG